MLHGCDTTERVFLSSDHERWTSNCRETGEEVHVAQDPYGVHQQFEIQLGTTQAIRI